MKLQSEVDLQCILYTVILNHDLIDFIVERI